MRQPNNIIIALDTSSRQETEELISKLSPPINFYKIGLELYIAEGNDIVKSLKERGLKVFLDLKLHDIPNTVSKAAANIAKLKPDMITVHTLGGLKMLEAAVESVKQVSPQTKVLGVTVLTSLDEQALRCLGVNVDIKQFIIQLGEAAYESGCDGLVCSAADLTFLRPKFKEPFLLVTPGIRLEKEEAADQIRTATVNQALQNGADYLVIGRSVTKKANPKKQLEQLIL